ncbi:MAG: hypothetical protein A3C80_01745 [Candidatus Ryanbacteria bacterium RIFCSPHIGHO2_02_FULL_45_43]|uniref:UDP-N-acetylglucosamine--N-acetylmuramyl-(pentapeptide) pyrophosphoryl-undecaprenol N-acetylglucosamine transferase n=1 Tax=Candidatus Ryanbacteria bacterium RIFCSPHIGHO2_01_45_13 TaxID=1802112 RepID=A0A1G2FY07_9BACT|nr:MAG: hypothetical protein A2718_02580 [Candidatus Ryanbacteria bacterium RIFCSPHIGHO2_01_FULL_44_130]OGZ42964.1 MAG: hypothetical protein A2W41_02520 [Candidatus Ryanbacteria bacterium RIFCSPHIGHO2_01_45_13]OGZ48669.1 MAG: hypothetical protein A3C80_01745 [Candidatus Ryanbacteria bacterium RIFCSPHIGHO2_02_FULL_45_43]OGZ50609.1 MAG: hypothetical protein A3E55_03225 [Candidatus Ryanbacteria bacterium RIFCSPHIGHO2_12_FULL_44_20]OGZ51915.1 MAG: hypothetical protein A3A17_00600 [Candidatus Ryanba
MKITLLGGGTGGHFYPLIAIARELKNIKNEEHIVQMNITLAGDIYPGEELLRSEEMSFRRVSAGKFRRYFSLLNMLDIFKTLLGIFKEFWHYTTDPPDIIFSKGGYASFPSLVAARLYKIPVIIHESDAVPGIVNKWTARFAERVAIAFPEAVEYFPKEKTALVGNPIRRSLLGGSIEEALDIFNLEEGIPTILILGGSQGAEALNNTVLSALGDLLVSVQIIHQAGPKLYKAVANEAMVILDRLDKNIKNRYHVYPFLYEAELRNAAYISDVIVSRAGAGGIFEIAAWGKPSIIIPLPSSAGDHQRENAYSYARSGACEILEQNNLTTHLFQSHIMKIVDNKEVAEKMKRGAQSFAKIDAAKRVAKEIVRLGTHE